MNVNVIIRVGMIIEARKELILQSKHFHISIIKFLLPLICNRFAGTSSSVSAIAMRCLLTTDGTSIAMVAARQNELDRSKVDACSMLRGSTVSS